MINYKLQWETHFIHNDSFRCLHCFHSLKDKYATLLWVYEDNEELGSKRSHETHTALCVGCTDKFGKGIGRIKIKKNKK